MGASRNLEGEIDRVLRKVQEGVVVFDSIWNKVYDTENCSQKEKFEADLKKEIKKLQRYRDKIKGWIQSSGIKEKKVSASYERALMDARKQIEREMERYRICEKETKTKAFSKEGLSQQPRSDPKEKAKAETSNWINNVVSELENQIDNFEAEIEGISLKKGRQRPPRLVHLEKSIARHNAHIKILESILRFLDNDELSPPQVNDVKDFIEDYVERNQEDFDEFSDVEDIYSTLHTERVEPLEYMVSVAPSSLIKGVADLSTTEVLSTNSQTATSPTQSFIDNILARKPDAVQEVSWRGMIQIPYHSMLAPQPGAVPEVSQQTMTQMGSTLHRMSLQQLKDITNNFRDELGRGGFGVVYKGVLENGQMVAVKKLVHSMPSSQEQFENEVNLLMKLDHRNIVRLVGYCYETQHLHTPHEGKFVFAWNTECLLCLECLPNGSLDKYVSDPSSGLDWHSRYKIIEGITYGLQYLHEQPSGPIIHLDLKPANILLDVNMAPKIADFGLSRLIDQKQTICTAITSGTLGYMPPEYLRGIITPMSDIFGLGVIIMEVIMGHREYPYDIRKESEDFIDLELGKWRSVLQKEPGYMSREKDCKQIKRCIQIGLICVNPVRTKRPTIKKVIDMLQGLESMSWYISNELSGHDIQGGP